VDVRGTQRANRSRDSRAIAVVGQVDDRGVVHRIGDSRAAGSSDRVAYLISELYRERYLLVGLEVHDQIDSLRGSCIGRRLDDTISRCGGVGDADVPEQARRAWKPLHAQVQAERDVTEIDLDGAASSLLMSRLPC
jgi:hypothetical protein